MPTREAASAGMLHAARVTLTQLTSSHKESEGQRDGVCLSKGTGERRRRHLSTKLSGPQAWGLATFLRVQSHPLDAGPWPEEMGKMVSVLPEPDLWPELDRPACHSLLSLRRLPVPQADPGFVLKSQSLASACTATRPPAI